MDAEDRAGEFVGLAVPRLHLAGVEDAVPAVEPAVGPPGQRVGQLVGVGAAEAGRDDLAGVGLAVAVGVAEEEDVGRVGDPDAAVADGDARGDVEALGEDREPVGLAVAVGVLEDLDAVAARSGGAAGIFEALGDPDPPALVEGHGDRVDDVGLGGDDLDAESRRHGHGADRLGRRSRRVGRPVLAVGDDGLARARAGAAAIGSRIAPSRATAASSKPFAAIHRHPWRSHVIGSGTRRTTALARCRPARRAVGRSSRPGSGAGPRRAAGRRAGVAARWARPA